MAKAWVEAFQGMGYGCTADPFSGVSTGGYSNLASVDYEKKQRSYAATGYGLPAMGRQNVKILTEATVQKILFSTSDNGAMAVGVEAKIDGQTVTVKARREVILTAGAVNTPKLLELSGIGDKERLEQLSIPVIVENSNVGENLQDHLMTGISFEVKSGIATGDPLLRQEPETIQTAFQLYSEQKTGPMTIGGIQSSAYMPLTDHSGQPEARQAYLDSFPPVANERDQVIRDIYTQEHEPTCQMFMFLAQANLHESGKSFVGQNLLPGNFLSLGITQNPTFLARSCPYRVSRSNGATNH